MTEEEQKAAEQEPAPPEPQDQEAGADQEPTEGAAAGDAGDAAESEGEGGDQAAGPADQQADAESDAPGGRGPEGLSPEELDEARANEVAYSWQASEYVHHHKGVGWYAGLFGGLAVLVLVTVFLKAWMETGLFVVMGGALLVYARKPPRTLMYELTPKGITIEGKEHPFAEFRSFGVLKDDDWHTIDLEPMKRLAPRLAILFDPEDMDPIVGHLELHLPRADREQDPIEKLSRYLRF